jgi:NAD+ synthase
MDWAKLSDKLVLWIRDQVLNNGSLGVVFGLSGGLDSSVVAALCKRAFAEEILGVIMPCCSMAQDAEHARLVAAKFAIPTREVVLDGVLDTLLGVLPPTNIESGSGRLAKANLQVRLRMITLYYFANQSRYFVVGSGNRSELAIGYFTKYGDGGTDILPLGNLVKGQVRELALFLGVPQPIIDKPPSAGLWEGQTDEVEMGISYQELDRYLLNGEATAELKQQIESRIAASAHKRLPPPVAGL